jgi:hypothetical protein
MLLQKWRKWKLFYGAVPCTLNHWNISCDMWTYQRIISDTSYTLAVTHHRIMWAEADIFRLRNGTKEGVSEIFCSFTDDMKCVESSILLEYYVLSWGIAIATFGTNVPPSLTGVKRCQNLYSSERSVSNYLLTQRHLPQKRKILLCLRKNVKKIARSVSWVKD